MIYYISDTHFGHENVIEMCGRPFSDIDEMNSALIERWNAKIKGNDTVYVLGDMFFRCVDPGSILKQLKGKKRLLIGNHDGSWMTKLDAEQFFESIDRMLEISIGNHGVTLCHYPLLTWRHQKKTYMIHGHIHNDTTSDYWPLIRSRERLLNAGVDINKFEPVTLEELIENNMKFKDENRNQKAKQQIVQEE